MAPRWMTIILLGNPDAAYKIFDTYKKRIEDRVAKVKQQLTETTDFSSDRTVDIDRRKRPGRRTTQRPISCGTTASKVSC